MMKCIARMVLAGFLFMLTARAEEAETASASPAETNPVVAAAQTKITNLQARIAELQGKIEAAENKVHELSYTIRTNEIVIKGLKGDEKKAERELLETKNKLLALDLEQQQATLNELTAELGGVQKDLRATQALKVAEEQGLPTSYPDILAALNKGVATNLQAHYVFLQAGLLSQAPFRLTTKADGVVMEDSGGSDVRGYLEATFRHRTAWLRQEDVVFADQSFPLLGSNALSPLRLIGRLGDCLLRPFTDTEPVSTFMESVFGDADLVPKDYEVRIGLASALGGSTADSTTVAGTGDAYVEGSLGWRLLYAGFATNAIHGNQRPLRTTFNLEALGGASTDRDFQDVHVYRAIGVATVWGIDPAKGAGNKNRTEMIAGVYWGQLEVPQLASDEDIPESLDGQKVVKSRNGDVDFSNEHAMMIRADMHLPMGDSGYFIVSGRYWNGLADIEPWSLSIGYSMPIGAP